MVEFLSLKLIYSQKGVNTASFLDYKVAKAFASLRPSEYFWGFTWQPFSNAMGSQSPSDFIWPKFNNSLFIFLDDIWITSRRESWHVPSVRVHDQIFRGKKKSGLNNGMEQTMINGYFLSPKWVNCLFWFCCKETSYIVSSVVLGIELQCIIRHRIIHVLYHMKCFIPTVGQIACIELCMEPRICGINSI